MPGSLSSSSTTSPSAASLAPPLSFTTAHSPAPSTSGESTASTPVGGSGNCAFLAHTPVHHHVPHHSLPAQLHASVVAHPRLQLNTMLAVDDSEYYAHGPDSASRGAATTDRKSPSNTDIISPVCSFEAYSLHFHLPLKTAAEKFGVRATAFKKRCRSIGIRHWPYRKVRSLRRSLQELDRSQEQGPLNDKQQYQFATFKKQLDKLLSPETYGIDPSGRIPHGHFDDSDDDSDDNESCGSALQSPRYGAAFGDCNISPADGERTFGDFSTPPHLRLLRTKHPYMHASSFPRSMPHHFGHELHHHHHHHPLQRLQAPSLKDAAAAYPKFSFGMFDPYAHDEAGGGRAKLPVGGAFRAHEKDDASDQQPSSGMDTQPHHFLPSDVKYEDVQSLNDADDEFADATGQMDYTNDRFFDDVFLQISPDYGCLV